MDREIFLLAEKLGAVLASKGMKITVAESCTGGGICQAITDVPGSSAWFDRGFITYSNQAKMEMLGVNAETLKNFGAVSEQTALEMVEGALQHSDANIAIAVTGIAGPKGGTPNKPVGTVFIGKAVKGGESSAEVNHFSGDRSEVRRATVCRALEWVVDFLSE